MLQNQLNFWKQAKESKLAVEKKIQEQIEIRMQEHFNRARLDRVLRRNAFENAKSKVAESHLKQIISQEDSTLNNDTVVSSVADRDHKDAIKKYMVDESLSQLASFFCPELPVDVACKLCEYNLQFSVYKKYQIGVGRPLNPLCRMLSDKSWRKYLLTRTVIENRSSKHPKELKSIEQKLRAQYRSGLRKAKFGLDVSPLMEMNSSPSSSSSSTISTRE